MGPYAVDPFGRVSIGGDRPTGADSPGRGRTEGWLGTLSPRDVSGKAAGAEIGTRELQARVP